MLSLSAVALLACSGGGVTPGTTAGTGSSTSGSGGSTSGGSTGGSGSGGSGSSSGGGGATVTASPYILFASGYIGYATQTNGAYLHSAQGGDVYTGFGGNLIYGNYSSPQGDMNRTGLYTLQAEAAPSASANPTTAADYVYMAFLAPADGLVDISQAATLLIQMGNTVASPVGGNATVFTVDINNAAGTTAATGDCSYNQTLAAVGTNVALTALGARTYAIPLSAFTCTTGTLATLQSAGITTVAVKIVGNSNPSMVKGEYDTIAVGTIGFTGTMSAAEITTLNTL